MEDFVAQVTGVGALAEPARRSLYRYVVAQPRAVSRDQAATGVGLPRHTAKFHLDRLVADGLLDTEFRRLPGRRGPGAGRPTKFYRRADRQFAVSLPERSYELAGQVLAAAVERADRDGVPVRDAVQQEATPPAAGWPPADRAATSTSWPGCWPDTATSRGAGRPAGAGQLPVPRSRPGAHRPGLRAEPAPAGRAGRRAGCGPGAGPARSRPGALLRDPGRGRRPACGGPVTSTGERRRRR